MTTRTYADLLLLIQALCGEVFSTIELPRTKALINNRARTAYMASQYWPRWLVVGEERSATGGVVPFTEGSLDEIESFIRIHKEEPFIDRQVQEYSYHVGGSGAVIVGYTANTTDTVWATYRKRNTATYGDGDGETSDIPAEWFDYMAHGVYADWLRAEKLYEVAVTADAEADLILSDELAKVDNTGMAALVYCRTKTHQNEQALN